MFEHVMAARRRLEGQAHVTPVMTSATFNERVGGAVVFKCENFQRAGAFKFRGAYNALSRLGDAERARGVVAYSSGNHAQGVAAAARLELDRSEERFSRNAETESLSRMPSSA